MQTKLIIKYISNWLHDYINSCNANGFVIGVSGGIDSAVTSTIAAKTNLPLICLEMPIHQNSTQVSLAKEHIKFLQKKFSNVKSIETNLSPIFDEFLKNEHIDAKNKLALANLRSRLRMMTLYYFAQTNNHLVLGTGNKVEDFGIGFFTKYGDGGVDISPIADLLKSEVFELGRSLNVCENILNADPTDGLWDDNKNDFDQIGATYPELEWAMQFSGNINLLSKREAKVLKIYNSLNKDNQHKIKMIPVCKIPKNLK